MTPAERIRARIDAGLRRAGERTGTGEPMVATLIRTLGSAGSQKPWDEPIDDPAAAAVQTFPVTVMESGVTTRYGRDEGGALIPRTVRVLLVSAAGEAPRMGDRIEIGGQVHELARVSPVQPGGIALLFDCEAAI